MKFTTLSPEYALKFNRDTIDKKALQKLQKGVKEFLKFLDKNKEGKQEHSERFAMSNFLKSLDYTDEDLAYEQDKIDLAILDQGSFAVIFETKSSLESKDMPTLDKLNCKAMQQMIFYYFKQRKVGNTQLKNMIISNGYDWFIFDNYFFDKIFYKNRQLFHDFESFLRGAKSGKTSKYFYEKIASPFLEKSEEEMKAIHFNLKDYASLKVEELTFLYKTLASENLLKKRPVADSNQLNEHFFAELLYIMGLEERKINGKKLIRERLKPNPSSLLENIKSKIKSLQKAEVLAEKDLHIYGSTAEERLFGLALELVLTWVNRLLFLKLLEGQLVEYHTANPDAFKFLDYKKIQEFEVLETLFFEVLNKPVALRREEICTTYSVMPYLNSSLFAPSELEQKVLSISNLKNNLKLPLFPQTALVNETKKELPTLDYFLQFLEAYNFASHDKEDVYTEKGELINAAVLGLVFEKINGYKEGSFFTPGFITEYMARKMIRQAIIQKFNAAYQLNIENFSELRNYTAKDNYKTDKILEYNKLVNSLKIVDPAVGSGHFLVSALNEILYLKSELGILADPQGNRLACQIEIDNDILIVLDKDFQLFRYHLDTENNINPQLNKIQKGLFHEKESIIKSCLFGVDINQNSVKICQLRLWIELLKNTYYSIQGGYMDLVTLPNIDINIKHGNSLISLFGLNGNIQKLSSKLRKQQKLATKQHKEQVIIYKSTSDRQTKRNAEKKIKEIKEQFSQLANPNDADFKQIKILKEQIGSSPIFFSQKEKNTWLIQVELKMLKLEKLEAIYQEKLETIYLKAFEWRFEFPEVLDDDGNFEGFDIVIGNPPYIQLQSMGRMGEALGNFKYETYNKTGDIYAIFYELGCNILKPKSFLAFITSNKWMRANYGQTLRKYLIQKSNPKILVDLGSDVFKSATVDSNILCIQKGKTEQFDMLVMDLSQEKKSKHTEIEDYEENGHRISDLSEKAWTLLSPAEQSLKSKIEQAGKPLKDWNIKIYRGILTGLNEAFIIDEKTKNKLIAKDPKSAEIIKPILRGRDIKKYEVQFADLYLINTHNGYTNWEGKKVKAIDIEDYPAIKKWLDRYKFRKKLKKRCDKGRTHYNLRSCAYVEEFEKEKIIFQEMVQSPAFIYDSNGHFCLDTGRIITGESLKFLLSIFNSKLFFHAVKKYYGGGGLGSSGVRMKHTFFENTPIPEISETLQKTFEDLVDAILLKKEQGEDTKEEEKEVDKLVYELYGLTRKEIKLVEKG